MRLDQGRVRAEVSPQENPFKVLTPHLEVKVVGTRFDVGVEKSGSQVVVQEGFVEVRAPALEELRRLSKETGWWQMASGRGVNMAMARKVSVAPRIDGEIDNIWNSQVQHLIGFPGESKSLQTGSSKDHSSWWKAVWDDEALYVLIEVTDDNEGTGNKVPWANDSTEIFVDADHSPLQQTGQYQ